RDQAVGSSGDGFRGREPDLGTAVLRQGGSGHGDRLLRPDAHRGQPCLARTIFIDTDAVRPSQFDLSGAEREQLYTKGRQAATDFLDGTDDQDAWDFDRYRERFRTGPSAR